MRLTGLAVTVLLAAAIGAFGAALAVECARWAYPRKGVRR